jgi:hypothetical protein
MTSRAGVARRKGKFVKKCSTRFNSEQETWKGRTEVNRCWKFPQCKTRIKDSTTNYIEGCGSEESSHLGSEERSKKPVNEIFRGNIAKQVVGTSNGLRKIRKCALWRAGPLPKRKKEHRIEEPVK